MRFLRLWLTDWEGNTGLIAIRCLLLSGLLGLNMAAVGQNVCTDPRYTTYKGEFSVDKTKICLGTSITVTHPANLASAGYVYEYDGSAGIPTRTTTLLNYTYTKPGTYTIVQVGSGNGAGTGTLACQVVDVVDTKPVSFTATACSARRVLVNMTLDESTGKYDNYRFDWGDGAIETKNRASVVGPITHVYNTNGIRVVTVTGLYNPPATCVGRPNSATVAIAAPASQPVITKLTSLNNNTVSLQYTAGSGTSVLLLQKDATGDFASTGQTGAGPGGSFTVQANASQEQCFQVAYQDACNLISSRSDEVCSLVFTAEAANKQNQLRWQAYNGTSTPFRQYRLTRNGTGFGPVLTNRTNNAYLDNQRIDCGVQYCYTLEATAGATVITSAPACVTGINSDVPGDFRTVVVSVENNRPRLTATLPTTGTTANYTIAVSRSTQGGAFESVGTLTNTNLFVDNGADALAGSYCYQLTYQNNCGLSSAPSKPVCSVFLNGKSKESIDWTAASPFAPGSVASYTLEIIDSLNGTKREIPMGTNTSFAPDPNDPNLQAQTYRIIAEAQSGISSYSNFFTFRRNALILAPDAFSPNQDGLNDVFLIKGVYIARFTLTIFDRWGNVVYATADQKQGWDGMINGIPALEGQYMYRVDIDDLTGEKTVRTGRVLLLR